MNVGLFGGSFNPIHLGHLEVALYMVEQTDVDEVWFLLSPQNPLKQGQNLISDALRLEMLHLAVDEYPKFKVCDIEIDLPKPNYTVDTLMVLAEKYPKCRFSLIVGEDNLQLFEQWKDYDKILNNYSLLVYPRKGYSAKLKHPNIRFVSAPEIVVSSTQIRHLIREGKKVDSFISPCVEDFILKNNLYKQ